MTLAKHATNFAYQMLNRPKAPQTIFSAFGGLRIYMIRSRVHRNTSHQAKDVRQAAPNETHGVKVWAFCKTSPSDA